MKICYTPQDTRLEIRNVNYVKVQRPQNYIMSHLDGRKQHSFLYTATGTMKYSFSDNSSEELVSAASELVFIPAGAKHISTYIEEQNVVYILQFDLSADTFPDYLVTPVLIHHKNMEQILSSIANDLDSGTGDNPLYLLYRIYELLWYMSQNAEKHPVKYRKLQIALREMHLYYSDNHKVHYYADLCGMSEPGFRRLFKEYTNMSPIEYRNRIRLQEAKKLLYSGEFSVEEAALTVGYSNLPFFCRSYKQQFGHSPGKDI